MALTQHWKLDDNAASTTVVATVGMNATLLGGDNTSAKTTAGPGGSITAGLALNGTDDAIDISASSISFADGAAFSVNLWFNASAAAGMLVGISVGNSPTIRKTTDTSIGVSTASVAVGFVVQSLGTGTWRHLLVTRTAGNSARCFIDGVESSTGAQSCAGIFAPTRLGIRNATFFAGSEAQVKVFDSDESANVAALYAEGLAAGVPQTMVIQ